MSRILFFLLLALAAYVGWRWWRTQQLRGDGAAGRSARSSGGTETMVKCEVCGLNLPQSDALPAPGAKPARWYCCEDHRRQGAAGS
jgi:hypothetical protein